ncbi:hypothetical protein JXB11_00145 [Candidatus Woesearchaeota archaeon]|nr:hypothetical protein [Candidatus Woesearchaeota archaeon]
MLFAIIGGLTGNGDLINVTGVDVPVVNSLANIINSLYFIFGGIIGVSIILLILRWRESYMIRKRMEEIEEGLLLINEKLDCVLKKKKKPK